MSSFKTPQTITYWLPGALNGSGGKVWAVGVKVAARVATKVKEVIGPDGSKQLTTNAIYSRVDIPIDAMIAVGDYEGQAAPEPQSTKAKSVIFRVTNETMSDMFMVYV